jgi:beta-glucuronidase
VVDLDSSTRTVRIAVPGDGRVALSQVLVHP